MDKKSIRREMRHRRRQLSVRQQRQAARQLSRKLLSDQRFAYARHWALYFANDGEISPAVLMDWLLKKRRRVYLPVLHPVYHNRLLFIRFERSTGLQKNKYGILEPSRKHATRIPAWALSVVCFPLVAFDRSGNRLGMGGGYYDRSFSQIRTRIKRPALIGLAHHFQQLPALPSEPWDIPLDAVATDHRVHRYKGTLPPDKASAPRR